MRCFGIHQRFERKSLNTKIKLLMLLMLVPLAVLIVLVLSALVKYSGQYDYIIRNLTVASEFSIDFQKNLDYKVYQYIISGKNFDEFNPFEDIEQARGVLARLKDTTTRGESCEQLKYIEKFLDNLEKSVGEIRDGSGGYDWNMRKLENDIRTNTDLVNDSVYQYIYYEARALADMREHTQEKVNNAVFSIGISFIVLFIVLCILAVGTSNSIANPIKELCENIRMVGEGDFTVRSVDSSSDEIKTLSETFESMVDRIGMLMENVKQEQQNLRCMELKLLQAQINPHFLYNTFDTIIWLAEDHQDGQVVEMVTSLSNFFRTTLSKGQDVISIREEELHVCSYLEIQQFRYRDILQFEIPIAKELFEYSVPKLTLQPLVENALYHGIKNKRGGGKIVVEGHMENGLIVLSVRDNGIGIRKEDLKRLRTSIAKDKHVGFGLVNLNERIRLYYGEEYGLQIDSVYGEGTTVTVKFPAKEI